jgi:hypothetical protein
VTAARVRFRPAGLDRLNCSVLAPDALHARRHRALNRFSHVLGFLHGLLGCVFGDSPAFFATSLVPFATSLPASFVAFPILLSCGSPVEAALPVGMPMRQYARDGCGGQ